MPRGGLSNDPDARQKQLDALKRGREKTARKLLGLDDAEAPPAERDASPSSPPVGGRKTKAGSFDPPAAKPKPRKKAGSSGRSKGPAAEPPEPEPEPERRGGFLAGLRDGFSV